MADEVIRAQAVQPTPAGYTVPGAQEIIVKSVRAFVDGTSAASSFLAVLQLVAPDGSVVWEAPTDTTVAAGASANVSWFPHVTTNPFQPSTLGKWTPYTATFSATGGGAIGNGTVTASYFQLGVLVVVKIDTQFGTTSAFGTGLFSWTLPVPAVATLASGGMATDSVAAGVDVFTFGFVQGQLLNAIMHQPTNVGGLMQFVNHNQPVTWASGDQIRVMALYQAA